MPTDKELLWHFVFVDVADTIEPPPWFTAILAKPDVAAVAALPLGVGHSSVADWGATHNVSWLGRVLINSPTDFRAEMKMKEAAN
jgi:hypothetical protein